MRRLLLGLLFGLFATQVLAQAVTVGACTGYTSVIRSGIQAKVSPGASNRIRQSPGLQATRIGEIPPGGVLAVLYGPACADNYTWWLIRYQNTTGWTAEGEGSTHWIVPASAENHAPNQPPDALGGTSTSVFYSIGLCIGIFDTELMNSFRTGTGGARSDSVTFALGQDSLRVEPGVCVPLGVEGEAVALSPFGVEIPADVTYLEGFDTTTRVTLPDIAYTIPGVWSLRVRDYTLFVDIQAPTGPFLQSLAGQGGTYSLLLGGFSPGERIVIVVSHTTSSGVGYTPDESEIVEEFEPGGRTELSIMPEILTTIQDAAVLDMTVLTRPEVVIEPEAVGVLDGVLTTLEPVMVDEVSKLVFDRIADIDIRLLDDIGMDQDGAPGIFGLTFQDFSGMEVQADANGFVLANVTLGGSPLAAIGQSGALAIWPNLAELYVPGGDADALRQTLYAAYWADDETQHIPCTYTVESGDTLNRIARSFNITLESLLAANPQIANPDVIRRGLVLNIPNCTQ